MQSHVFYQFGTWVYRWRLAIIVGWIIVLIGCVPFLANLMQPFQSTGFEATHSESQVTGQYLDSHLGYQNNKFLIIYHHPELLATSAAYQDKLKQSLAGLKHFPLPHEIIYPTEHSKQISKDKHTAYVVVLFKEKTMMAGELLKQFKAAIKTPSGMHRWLGGQSVFIESVNEQTQEDLYRADEVAAPMSIITLILVFGTLVAALVPIVLGGGCALIILTSLYFLGHLFSLSIFTINIALLLGLCLSLDYALFMVYRFREELKKTRRPLVEVIAVTVATSGRAVFFSGLAVFVSLSALLLFPINILFSIGVGGLVAVLISVLIALTLLPATLSVLHHGINRLSVQCLGSQWSSKLMKHTWHVWQAVAKAVVKKPVLFVLLLLAILFFLGWPVRVLQVGISDMDILPPKTASYQFLKTYENHFDENELTPILVVVKATHGDILSPHHIEQLYHFVQRLKDNSLVAEVQSIVNINSQMGLSQYQQLYQMPKEMRPDTLKQLLKITTTSHFTVVSVVSKYNSNSSKTMKLIKQLRHMKPGEGLHVSLTGIPVSNLDVLHSIAGVFPYAVLWIMALTYCILLVLLRSVFLPLKAIVMNILSLTASYGVLVFVFQLGHFHHLLNFLPQGMIDVSLLIIIFCALFGFSMDYEVFLLTRIKEFYDATHRNNDSIVFGIEKSCRIITSAAIIVIILCGSFMVADVLMVKEFGLGIAVAIFVDAFLIRTFLVPAVMVLMNKWNWYLPKWLGKILP